MDRRLAQLWQDGTGLGQHRPETLILEGSDDRAIAELLDVQDFGGWNSIVARPSYPLRAVISGQSRVGSQEKKTLGTLEQIERLTQG